MIKLLSTLVLVLASCADLPGDAFGTEWIPTLTVECDGVVTVEVLDDVCTDDSQAWTDRMSAHLIETLSSQCADLHVLSRLDPYSPPRVCVDPE